MPKPEWEKLTVPGARAKSQSVKAFRGTKAQRTAKARTPRKSDQAFFVSLFFPFVPSCLELLTFLAVAFLCDLRVLRVSHASAAAKSLDSAAS